MTDELTRTEADYIAAKGIAGAQVGARLHDMLLDAIDDVRADELENDPFVKALDQRSAFAMAWGRIERLVPQQRRQNKRTNRDELVQEVAVVFRRKTGQWWVTVGSVNGAKPTAAEAARVVADTLERNAARRR